jgi:phosphoglycerate dehydrogenase-like enzyme
VKVGCRGTQDLHARELVKQLQEAHPRDQFLPWPPGIPAPALDLDVLIALGPVGAPELEGQTRLGLVQTAGAGYEEVDLAAARAAGIWVASAPTTRTGNGESVAEYAVLLMLAASRRLNEELAYTRDRATPRPEKPQINRALFGKTVCIVGLGGIGDLLVERLRGFGVVLTGVDRHPERAPAGVKGYATHALHEALATADYVVLAVPGSKENANLIDAAALGAMKQGAVLVNVARGTLVDETALLAAVTRGHLYAAGLDVVKEEPVQPGDPLLAEPLIVVTPHIAGATDLMLAGTVKYLGEVLTRYASGQLPDALVNAPPHPRVALHSAA